MVMITIRCTQKLRKYLDIHPVDKPEPAAAVLGDWYVNLVPKISGGLIIFMCKKTLLTIAIPAWESDELVPLFRMRLANLLGMIGIHPKDSESEINHYDQAQFCRTTSRSALGSLNDFAWHYQMMVVEARGILNLNLSEAELKLSRVPCKPIDYRYPSEAAKKLLSTQTKSAC